MSGVEQCGDTQLEPRSGGVLPVDQTLRNEIRHVDVTEAKTSSSNSKPPLLVTDGALAEVPQSALMARRNREWNLPKLP